MEVLPDHL
jgi:hypothetical protein